MYKHEIELKEVDTDYITATCTLCLKQGYYALTNQSLKKEDEIALIRMHFENALTSQLCV